MMNEQENATHIILDEIGADKAWLTVAVEEAENKDEEAEYFNENNFC